MTAQYSDAIVVGVDGSPGAEAALDWALGEARARHTGVRLTYAYDRAGTYGSVAVRGTLPPPDIEVVRSSARRLLTAAAARASRIAPDVVVSSRPVGDYAVPALLAESRHAPLVVLGSRRRGAVGSVLLGSVSAAVSARADCPVVVVRGPAGSPAERAGVVVGVDPSDDSTEPLEFAFEYASRRSLPIHPIYCWHPDLLAEMMWRPEPPAPEWVDARLADIVATWADKYPQVRVHAAVERGHPADVLVAASSAQHLLVVGTSGRPARTGTMLGSVSQGVLHHATCPVAVIPSSANPTEQELGA